jgi:hypothetical protein
MAAPAFTQIRVNHRFRGNTAVYWSLSKLFQPSGDVEFGLEWARTPAGEWMKADQAVLFDSGVALDPEQRLFGATLDLFYRVRATTEDGIYYSPAAQVGAHLDGRGWLQVQELIRLAELNYANNTDVSPGCLIKRRVWGKRCRRCTDNISGQTVRSECRVCFGTGVVGGYYRPTPCAMILQPRKRKYEWADDAHGSHHASQRAGSCLAYPIPVDERDLWYSARTGEIYIIAGVSDDIEDSLKLGDFVIEQKFPLEMTAAGSLLYELPLESCGAILTGDEACVPWTEPEPECLVPVPDVPAPGRGTAGPDRLPLPEIPVEPPPTSTNEQLELL